MVCGLWSMVNPPKIARFQPKFVERVERNGGQPQFAGGFERDEETGKLGHYYSARVDLMKVSTSVTICFITSSERGRSPGICSEWSAPSMTRFWCDA